MSRVKVLLADDVELFLELEKTFFREGEYHVLTARRGDDALTIIREEKPDAVFMDLYMPGMDGDKVCRAVKDDPELQTIPVLMVTQSGREQDLKRCREAGCDDILLKPVNRHHFLEAARKAIQVAERIAPRVAAPLEIRFGPEGEHRLADFTVNISTGGVFIETENLLPVDTTLEMEFQLPDSDSPLICVGRIAWVNHPEWIKKDELPVGMGVQFTKVHAEDQSRLRAFIREKTLSVFSDLPQGN